MTEPPVRCVVDTNVAVISNGHGDCSARSARALQGIMERGHLFLDDGQRILGEYRDNLSARGQPGPGDAFLKWVLTNEWNATRVTHVAITPCGREGEDFLELPEPPAGVAYDPSDRKFLAVAAAHPERPPVLQAMDSKWWGWRDALAEAGVTVWFLCPDEIAAKHAEKTKR